MMVKNHLGGNFRGMAFTCRGGGTSVEVVEKPQFPSDIGGALRENPLRKGFKCNYRGLASG